MIRFVRLPRNAQLWLPGVIVSRLKQMIRPQVEGVVDVLFCIADHFEPNNGRVSQEVQTRRVERWLTQYPIVTKGFVDFDGCAPQHTYFFPAEAYAQTQVELLGELCKAGLGEVEVHLHHGNDTRGGVQNALSSFRDTLWHEHGLLSSDRQGKVRYAFIHGNWALDNGSLDDEFCGVNEEISVLLETGCYADFTMPAAPEFSQSVVVNSIYYVQDDPAPRSYDRGRQARVGQSPLPDELLMINGPLSVHLEARIQPLRVENGALDSSPDHRPSVQRFRRWVSQGISVAGREEWVFVKVYSHGAPEQNAGVMLGDAFKRLHEDLARDFNDGIRFRLHYVSAREMYNIVRAAEAGHAGNPGDYRDFELVPQWRAGRGTVRDAGAKAVTAAGVRQA